MVSCYAPTRAASREDKEAFLQVLDNFLSSVPSRESFVILGDFNARVGSRDGDEGDVWTGVRGPHGLGAVNDAGRELLSFLSSHQATICNTWFEKKTIHKQTWQHPKSKQWSSIDLYGSECWVPLRKHLKKLNTFHHRCLRAVLGISNRQQWEQRISSATVRERWGDVETITTKLMRKHLEWLGHLARMPDQSLPKICLFSWLPQTRPQGGPRRRWRDLVKTDLKAVGVSDGCWYSEALDRKHWREVWGQRLEQSQQQQQSLSERQVLCSECGRSFRRESDKARHKCRAERTKPVREQAGAVQCDKCERWFRSRGGLAVHACRREEEQQSIEQPYDVTMAATGVTCIECGRNFR